MIRLGNALPMRRGGQFAVDLRRVRPAHGDHRVGAAAAVAHAKPGWVGTSSGREVKYLAEMASLAAGGDAAAAADASRRCSSAAYCTTSPLKLDTRSCDVLEAAMKYGFPVNFAPMPILGATTPMTPAGSGDRGRGRDPRLHDRHHAAPPRRLLLLDEHRRRKWTCGPRRSASPRRRRS